MARDISNQRNGSPIRYYAINPPKYTMNHWVSLLRLFRGTIVSRRLVNPLSLLKYSALHNAISPILAAIFSGNAIVVKCSEYVVWSTTWFFGAVKECLRVCGHDPDIIQVNVRSANKISYWIQIACRLLARGGRGSDDITLYQTYYVYRLGSGWTEGQYFVLTKTRNKSLILYRLLKPRRSI